MKIDADEIIEYMKQRLTLIDSADIPNIDLYMDQVTTFMDKHLGAGKRFEDDKILTKTMINNYAKNDLLPSPEKKRYSREHLLLLIFIYYLKNTMSISDIKTLITPLNDEHFQTRDKESLDEIYHTFFEIQNIEVEKVCSELTESVASITSLYPEADPSEQEFLQTFSIVSSLAYDIYLKKLIIENIIDGMNGAEAAEKANLKKASAEKAKAKKEAAEKAKKAAEKAMDAAEKAKKEAEKAKKEAEKAKKLDKELKKS